MRNTMIVTALCSACTGATHSATIHVPGDYSTIAQATAVASNGDTIVIGPGTWKETIRTYGKAITVTSASGPEVTVIDGENIRGCIRMNDGEDEATVIRGLTITRGQSLTGGGLHLGYQNSASPIIEDCIFLANTATAKYDARGGAIYGLNSNIVIRNCTFENNHADESGGAIYLAGTSGTVTIENCSFISNTAPYGGGLLMGSFITVDNCTFRSNASYAIRNSQDWFLTLKRSVFCENSTGDIYNANWNDSGANLFLDFCDEGLCCTNGGCISALEEDCLKFLGTWVGLEGCDACEDSCNSDIDGNYEINVFDLLDLLENWGPCP